MKPLDKEILHMSNNLNLNYEKIFNSILTYQVIVGLDFRIIGATDAYIGISRAKKVDILGMSILEAFPENPHNPHSDGMKKLGESLRKVIETKQAHDMGILRYDIPSGSGDGTFLERWWRCRNDPVLNDNGEVQWIVSNVDDINSMMDIIESAEDTVKLKSEITRSVS
jgi:hypothetical protein